jgi:hypothetical protein
VGRDERIPRSPVVREERQAVVRIEKRSRISRVTDGQLFDRRTILAGRNDAPRSRCRGVEVADVDGRSRMADELGEQRDPAALTESVPTPPYRRCQISPMRRNEGTPATGVPSGSSLANDTSDGMVVLLWAGSIVIRGLALRA